MPPDSEPITPKMEALSVRIVSSTLQQILVHPISNNLGPKQEHLEVPQMANRNTPRGYSMPQSSPTRAMPNQIPRIPTTHKAYKAEMEE